jgi:hypothetical protein
VPVVEECRRFIENERRQSPVFAAFQLGDELVDTGPECEVDERPLAPLALLGSSVVPSSRSS